MGFQICFALGNIWRWNKSNNRNNLIKYAKKLNISGVELTFSSKLELFSFKLSKENKDWLKTLNYVSIHAPFSLISKSKNEKEIIKQLDLIEEIYNKINAKNVIIHPTELPPLKILNNYNFKYSTENMSKKKKVTITKMEELLNEYPEMGLCLDVAHAYRWSKNETGELIKNFKGKITQIHFSGTYKGKDHLSLKSVTKNFINSIKPIKELNVPIVIEEEIKIKSEKYLKEELKYIKSIFKTL